MKKILVCILCLLPSFSFCGEPLMLINPFRETFIDFPSATLPDKAVTIFLPEPAVPLHGKYPTVYLLGAWPKDAPLAQRVLDDASRKAILVGINLEESDFADTDKIVAFITRELVPYIGTNYPTVDDPSARAVVSVGPAGAKVLAALLARKNIFARAAVINGGTEAVSVAGADKDLRVLLAGTHAEISVWQQTLAEAGLHYGPDFVVSLGEEKNLFSDLNLDYLFAPAAELEVAKLDGKIIPSVLSLHGAEKAYLSVSAVLANKMRFDYLPSFIRFSPPYLNWEKQEGSLSVVPGASAGPVKMKVVVDKENWKSKIKLKK